MLSSTEELGVGLAEPGGGWANVMTSAEAYGFE